MWPNGTTIGDLILSASSPRPDPRINATLGLIGPRAAIAFAASTTRSAIDDPAESARGIIVADLIAGWSGRAERHGVATILAGGMAGELRVYLGRGDTGVAEQLAQLFQLEPLADLMRGERVAEHVRRHDRWQARVTDQTLHDQ